MEYHKLKDAKELAYREMILDWCKVVDLPSPIFEFRFDTDRKFRADLAYPMRDLLIEINGGAWIRGRHIRPVGYLRDMEKLNLAAMKGYFVLQYTPQQIRSGEAFWEIKKFFDRGKPEL